MKEKKYGQRFEEATEEVKKDKGFFGKEGKRISETWMYKLLIKSAYRMLNKPLVVFRVIKRAVARVKSYSSTQHFAEELQNAVMTTARLLRAYIRNEYREISHVNAALSLAALLYFISPFDLVPDFLAIGFLDDLALLTWVYKNFQEEIDDFRLWEDAQKVQIDIQEAIEM